MNRKKIKQLLEHLKWLKKNNKGHKFNMNYYFHHPGLPDSVPRRWNTTLGDLLKSGKVDEPVSPFECNTAACLAGFAIMLNTAEPANILPYSGPSPKHQAAAILGLDYAESSFMFEGHWSRKQLEHIRLPEAIKYLERVLERGTVFAY